MFVLEGIPWAQVKLATALFMMSHPISNYFQSQQESNTDKEKTNSMNPAQFNFVTDFPPICNSERAKLEITSKISSSFPVNEANMSILCK